MRDPTWTNPEQDCSIVVNDLSADSFMMYPNPSDGKSLNLIFQTPAIKSIRVMRFIFSFFSFYDSCSAKMHGITALDVA